MKKTTDRIRIAASEASHQYAEILLRAAEGEIPCEIQEQWLSAARELTDAGFLSAAVERDGSGKPFAGVMLGITVEGRRFLVEIANALDAERPFWKRWTFWVSVSSFIIALSQVASALSEVVSALR